MMYGSSNENDPNMANMMQQQQQLNEEGVLCAGSQFKDRNDMMSSSALAQAAQNFMQWKRVATEKQRQRI